MANSLIRIGTRGSRLALAQTDWVRDQMRLQRPTAAIEIVIIKTAGDRDPAMSIRTASATGVWVREIEAALLRGEIDVAVHSLKDLPTTTPDPLRIIAVPAREDARDALITPRASCGLAELPAQSTIGTGSIRRQAQLLALRPDLQVRDIRGNVDTRLKKLDQGEFDAVVVACAGLNRLHLQHRISSCFELREMLPAPGQGALAVEVRRDDARAAALLSLINHGPTATAVLAERSFLRYMGGGCSSPIAVHCRLESNRLVIDGLVATPDGTQVIRERLSRDPADPDGAAAELADILLSSGGRSILQSLECQP